MATASFDKQFVVRDAETVARFEQVRMEKEKRPVIVQSRDIKAEAERGLASLRATLSRSR
jgi:predicted nucleotide-binding protein